jgi:hypothetical protein
MAVLTLLPAPPPRPRPARAQPSLGFELGAAPMASSGTKLLIGCSVSPQEIHLGLRILSSQSAKTVLARRPRRPLAGRLGNCTRMPGWYPDAWVVCSPMVPCSGRPKSGRALGGTHQQRLRPVVVASIAACICTRRWLAEALPRTARRASIGRRANCRRRGGATTFIRRPAPNSRARRRELGRVNREGATHMIPSTWRSSSLKKKNFKFKTIVSVCVGNSTDSADAADPRP